MAEVVSPIEEVGALVMTIAATAMQMKRGSGLTQTVLYWNDATGDVVLNSGPEVDSAVWLAGRAGVVATFVGADGTLGYAHRWALATDTRYAHNLQATISGDGTALHNALVFNLNRGSLTGSVPVLTLYGGNAPSATVNGPITASGAVLTAPQNVLVITNSAAAGAANVYALFMRGAVISGYLFADANDNLAIARGDGLPAIIVNRVTGAVALTTLTPQFGASLMLRGLAMSTIEWGHANQAGYGSTIGYEASSGIPFIALNASAGTTANSYRTWGIPGIILKSNVLGGAFFYRATAATADNQVPTLTGGWSSTGQFLTDGAQGIYGIDTATGNSQFSLVFVPGTGTMLQSFMSQPLRLNHQGNPVLIDGAGTYVVIGTTDPGGAELLRVSGGIYTNAYVKVAPGFAAGGIFTNGVQMIYMSSMTGTGYTIINAPDGGQCMLYGSASDPGNYHNNSVHYFRNRDTTAIWFYINASGAVSNIPIMPRGPNSALIPGLDSSLDYIEIAVGATANICTFPYGMVELSEWQSYGDCAVLFIHNGGIEIVFQNATNRFGTSAAFYYQLTFTAGTLTLKNNSPNLLRFGGLIRKHK